MKTVFPLLRETFRQWDAHRVPKMGAALSFYTVFSLAPLSILVLSLLGLVVERNSARAEIVGQFRNFVGSQGAEMMELILRETDVKSTGSVSYTHLDVYKRQVARSVPACAMIFFTSMVLT